MTANNAKWLDAMEGKPGNDDLKKELREVGINVPPVTFYKYSSSGHWNNTMQRCGSRQAVHGGTGQGLPH